jgi:Na+/serine symporter
VLVLSVFLLPEYFLKMSSNKRKNIVLTISALFLLVAFISVWPYGFYTLMRFLVCSGTGFTAWMAYREGKEAWAWIMGFIAILFNPLIPIYLSRSTWQVIDLTVSIFLFVSLFKLRLSKERN